INEVERRDNRPPEGCFYFHYHLIENGFHPRLFGYKPCRNGRYKTGRLVLRQAFVCFNRRFIKQVSCEKGKVVMSEENITRLYLYNKEIVLIGTAHVSKHSAAQVKDVIEGEQPDTVCVELDQQRYQSIVEKTKWQEMDIFKVIKERKAILLLVNLVVSSFQKRMAKQFGIRPGEEMFQGIESARDIGAELVLADRDIQITFARIWRNVGVMGKVKLLMQVVGSIFVDEAISEAELEKMKSQDMLDAILQEFSASFPKLKTPLIDERDQYLSQKIKEAPGDKIVAVVGAAHVPGIQKQINHDHDVQRLSQ